MRLLLLLFNNTVVYNEGVNRAQYNSSIFVE